MDIPKDKFLLSGYLFSSVLPAFPGPMNLNADHARQIKPVPTRKIRTVLKRVPYFTAGLVAYNPLLLQSLNVEPDPLHNQ